MIKVKTFTAELRIFQTKSQLEDLDRQVNAYIEGNNIRKIISVSDAGTTDDRGATMGIIRVLCYESA